MHDTQDYTDLVRAYFDYQSTHNESLQWAWEAVDAEGFHDPVKKWQQILALVAAAPDDWQLGLLAAGPIETYLGLYGRDRGPLIQQDASANGRLKEAIALAWVEEM